MTLERLNKYKLELASAPSNQWGEILFRLANESAAEEVRNKAWVDPKDLASLRREWENTKLKLTIAVGALEVYADEGMFTKNEPPDELSHLAVVSLAKINKVSWLTENRPPELG